MDDSFRIEDFTVEPQLNRIRRGDSKIQIQSKAMAGLERQWLTSNGSIDSANSRSSSQRAFPHFR